MFPLPSRVLVQLLKSWCFEFVRCFLRGLKVSFEHPKNSRNMLAQLSSFKMCEMKFQTNNYWSSQEKDILKLSRLFTSATVGFNVTLLLSKIFAGSPADKFCCTGVRELRWSCSSVPAKYELRLSPLSINHNAPNNMIDHKSLPVVQSTYRTVL